MKLYCVDTTFSLFVHLLILIVYLGLISKYVHILSVEEGIKAMYKALEKYALCIH